MPLYHLFFLLPPSSHLWQTATNDYISPSLTAGSSSSCSFTQTRGQETMLSISRLHRKIKTQVPRPWQTTPSTASLSRHSYLQPPTRRTEPTATFSSDLKAVQPANHPAHPPCPLHSLSWRCFWALHWRLHLSCSHPRKNLQPLLTLLLPITGQYQTR